MKRFFLFFSIIALVACSKENTIQEDLLDVNSTPVIDISQLRINSENSSITSDEAVNVVKIANILGRINTKSISRQIDNVVPVLVDNDVPALYAVNFKNNEGFILVSASKNYYPILADVEIGTFDDNFQLSGISVLLETYKEGLKFWSNQPTDSLERMRMLWKVYENIGKHDVLITKSANDLRSQQVQDWLNSGASVYPLRDAAAILPSSVYQEFCLIAQEQGNESYDFLSESYIVETSNEIIPLVNQMIYTNWNQNAPYNYSCPIENGSYTLVGCGAIAVGQIMKYHQWPNNIQWGAMPNSLTATTPTVLSEFLYQLADNINTSFDINVSWSNGNDILYALDDVYGYLYDSSLNYSESSTRSSLTNFRPVVLQGTNPTDNRKAHFWVCDGLRHHTPGKSYALYIVSNSLPIQFEPAGETYQDLIGDNYYSYHMNWGWGSSYYNGWYLNQGFPGNNNYSQSMHNITNIRPNR